MKRSHLSLICILLGAALFLGAGALLLADKYQAAQAEKDATRILQAVQQLLPETTDRVPEARGNNTMASMEVDGVNVIGLLSFPQYGRTLPVSGAWDTHMVASLPCRFTGSIYDQSLIIGAVDSAGQLDFATGMDAGDTIVLTDMEGGRYTYRVTAIQHATHATLEKLQEGDHALTVYVKIASTSEYLLIRCAWDFG